jgi:hypothetical protein
MKLGTLQKEGNGDTPFGYSGRAALGRGKYNGFDQRVARQQLCKHSPLLCYATMEEALLSVPAVTSRHEIMIT